MKPIIPWVCAVAGLVALATAEVLAQSAPDIQNLAQRVTCERDARAQCPR